MVSAMKDMDDRTAEYKSFEGWNEEKPQMAAFVLANGKIRSASIYTVRVLFEEKARFHPVDQQIISAAYYAYVPKN